MVLAVSAHSSSSFFLPLIFTGACLMAVVVVGEEGAGSPVASPGLVRMSQAGLLPWLHTLASGLAWPGLWLLRELLVAPCILLLEHWTCSCGCWQLAQAPSSPLPCLPQPLLSPAHASCCPFCIGHVHSHLNFFFFFFSCSFKKIYLFKLEANYSFYFPLKCIVFLS